MPLLEDLLKLAEAIPPSDIPHVNLTPAVVGAIVKVLEHRDVTVPPEVIPEPPAAPVAGEHVQEIAQLKARVAELEAQDQAAQPPSAPPEGSWQ